MNWLFTDCTTPICAIYSPCAPIVITVSSTFRQLSNRCTDCLLNSHFRCHGRWPSSPVSPTWQSGGMLMCPALYSTLNPSPSSHLCCQRTACLPPSRHQWTDDLITFRSQVAQKTVTSIRSWYQLHEDTIYENAIFNLLNCCQ